jgi:2-C-methyl-D-erythritol 4-phosphate cytidylyltransferase
MNPFAAILPAAGRSVRFGPGRNKLYEPLAQVPVMVRSLQAFLQRPDVAAIVIPTQDVQSLHAFLNENSLADPRIHLCLGGATRAHSVFNALCQVPDSIPWVAVHDAARPLISQQLIDQTLAAAVEHGAAVPALPVHLTIKQAVGPLPAKVLRTLPRSQLFAMQTPQIMRRRDLREAFDKCPLSLDQVTDDVQLLELIGQEVWLVPGEEKNLKITTAADLNIAEMFVKTGS